MPALLLLLLILPHLVMLSSRALSLLLLESGGIFGSIAMEHRHNKVLVIGFLAFNMLAMLIWKKQLFLERGTISSVGVVILIGSALVLLFDISSLGWILSRLIQETDQAVRGLTLTLVFGGLCLFLLMGAKVMIDEIGREYSLGWEVLGEWIILYIFLTIQGIYNLTILMHLLRARRV